MGNWVQPGQPLMMLVPLDTTQLWIQANYKETELTHVYLGQPARVRVDTYPGVKFKGRVDSIMAGTGSAFSLLPPENATGNWVKVVQRVPVKIALTAALSRQPAPAPGDVHRGHRRHPGTHRQTAALRRGRPRRFTVTGIPALGFLGL